MGVFVDLVKLFDSVDLSVGRLAELLGDDHLGVLAPDLLQLFTNGRRRHVELSGNLGLRHPLVNELQHFVNIDNFFRHYLSSIPYISNCYMYLFAC